MSATSAYRRPLALVVVAVALFAAGWAGSEITHLTSDTTRALCRESSGHRPAWYARAKQQCEGQSRRTDVPQTTGDACDEARTYEELCRAVGSFAP